MKTVSLKINTYTRNVNIVNNNNLQRRILNVILTAFGFLAVCYVVFLGIMVSNVLERKNLESNARILSNEVGEMEVKYLFVSNKIDLNLAKSVGFLEIKEKQFATRKSLGSIKVAKNEL